LHDMQLIYSFNIRRPPASPLFPYTTLFRSAETATVVPDPNAPPKRRVKNYLLDAGLQLKFATYLVVVAAGISVDHDQVGRELERSEEHTSELQSRGHLVCRLLLEKKNTGTT